MKVAILSPTPVLEKFSAQSNYHLTLLHLYDNPAYRSFYNSRHEKGDFVILDNGANEGVEVDDSYLVQFGMSNGVSEIVAPDQPRDGVESTARTMEFVARHGQYIREGGRQLMGVPHGTYVAQWLENMHTMAPYVTTIGISKKVEEFIDRWNLAYLTYRYNYTRGNFTKQVHLLGADQHPASIRNYDPRWMIRGVDTQKIIAAAYHGIHLTEGAHKDADAIYSLDLAKDPGSINEALALENITKFKEWANA